MTPNASPTQMPFFDHLDELRARFMKCLWIFMGGFVLAYFWAEPMLAFLRKPLFDAMPPEQRKLYFTSLFENFMTHLKVAGYASAFFLSPLYFYQLWAFIAPGLTGRERRMVVPFVAAASLCFIGGAAFAYGVLFPVGFKYFVSYGGPFDVPLLTIESYYNTCLKLLLLFGLSFELPVLICLLGALGVVSSETLKAQRRNAIMGISVMAALFAPPDAMSMLILGIPLVLLYEAAIWVVYAMERGRKSAGQASGLGQAGAAGVANAVVPEAPPENPLVGRSRP
jgi:sec-independent protein translocase protein TatC